MFIMAPIGLGFWVVPYYPPLHSIFWTAGLIVDIGDMDEDVGAEYD
jgi:hypothetical protein